MSLLFDELRAAASVGTFSVGDYVYCKSPGGYRRLARIISARPERQRRGRRDLWLLKMRGYPLGGQAAVAARRAGSDAGRGVGSAAARIHRREGRAVMKPCVRCCGRAALDGHLTCGDVECDEAGARLDMEAAWRLLSRPAVQPIDEKGEPS